MGLLRKRVGPIWLSSIPKMAPWVPIQLSNAKMAFTYGQNSFGSKELKRNLGSFWPFLIYSVYVKRFYRFRRTTHAYFWHYLDCFRDPTICILVQVVIIAKAYSNDNANAFYDYVLCAYIYVRFLASISLL